MEPEKYADLVRIGLTEGEAKVYAALLELGPSSVGPITKRTKVSYSNIYEILERLMAKGIVSVIIKNNIRNFQPVDPTNLSQYLDRKEGEVKEQRDILQKALPRIEALQATYPKQEAQLFFGIKGLLAAYKELFADGGPGDENLWSYTHMHQYQSEAAKFYETKWLDIMPEGAHARGIAGPAYTKDVLVKYLKRGYEVRHVEFPIFAHGEVFKDRFLLVNWGDPITAVLVHAKDIADNYRRYWHSVWKVAKP